jgi:hypothetical protein
MPTILKAGGASDSLDLSGSNDGALTLQTGPSGAKVNALALASDGTPTFLKGRIVAQVQSTFTGAVATGTTVIPLDDTIPQITEGDQYMTLAFTPTNASSLLEITVQAHLANSGSGTLIGALFQDATANALTAGIGRVDGLGTPFMARVQLSWNMTAGTTSATTFRFRAGSTTAGTTTFNGFGGGRQLGGVMNSYITIKEYLP